MGIFIHWIAYWDRIDRESMYGDVATCPDSLFFSFLFFFKCQFGAVEGYCFIE